MRRILLLVAGTAMFVGIATSCGSSNDGAKPGGGQPGGTGGAPFIVTDGSSSSCVKLTCAALGATCGPQSDGCGDVIDCGQCTAPETCGGAGVASVCGGTTGCVPKTCPELGFTCGPAGDGCGAQLDCGQCAAPDFCGGGGFSRCGRGSASADGGTLSDGGTCTPLAACATGQCGPIPDGCGGLLQCGSCGAGEVCGLGGPSQCGAPACTKTTCAALGFDCGFAGDGCGGLLDCGGASTCTAPAFCGGGGPNRCGDPNAADGGAACVNFCQQQVLCDGGATTTVTGTVYAPNALLPIPDALVYVPNGGMTYPYGVQPFTDGVAGGACDRCGAETSGTPLVKTTSAYDGTFTLANVPVGTAIPLVIQVGRWRRIVTVDVPACATTALTASQTRLPTRQAEGGAADNIPLMAIATGNVDALECVIRKLGVEDGQFTNPSGNGRVRFYQDNGAVIDGNTPAYSTLSGSQVELDRYDALIFACRGGSHDINNTTQRRVIDVATNTNAYVNKGGRAFFTHFSYSWLYDIAPSSALPWPGTSTGAVNHHSWNNAVTGEVDVGFAKGQTFAQWLGVPAVNALSAVNPARIDIDEARHNMDSPLGAVPAQSWITTYQDNPEAATLHLTFNTPWNAAPVDQCGRVLFSSFHVTTNSSTRDVTFPDECDTNPMTPQEKVLAFMLFDLTSCITPDTGTITCLPQTCAGQGIGCGFAGDGCGGQLDCGTCPAGQVCQGSPAQCITPPCTPLTCAAASAGCGLIADGCGQTVDCGSCTTTGQVCGGGGPNQCGSGACTPSTCQAQSIQCGPAGDGCGGLLDCGPCPPGQTCGGGGVPGVCGTPSCTPKTCAAAGAQCGFLADGCGTGLDCGVCPVGDTCEANRCNHLQ